MLIAINIFLFISCVKMRKNKLLSSVLKQSCKFSSVDQVRGSAFHEGSSAIRFETCSLTVEAEAVTRIACWLTALLPIL